LSLLNENLDLVIKNNLPGVYSKKPQELSRWLGQQLYPVSPIIGATGLTNGGGRSAQARKFRMPGYPLVLVSTDVFQEGEDLHTFCDSVIHYGLSSSAVSIEQKTGRVDRVGAYAHRRLQNIPQSAEISSDDYIQVSFPFVKQSIETIQVRKLCSNINRFIDSLHDIGGSTNTGSDEMVVASRELQNGDDIPDQMLDFLYSPYASHTLQDKDSYNTNIIERDSEHYRSAIEHVMALEVAVSKEGIDLDNFEIAYDSARCCGEVILRVTKKHTASSKDCAGENCIVKLSPESKAWILNEQAILYEESAYRTYVVRVSDGYQLFKDAEMLVGGPSITQKEDLLGLFNRFSLKWNVADSARSVHTVDVHYDEREIYQYLTDKFSWEGKIRVETCSEGVDLVFQFESDINRQHRIVIRQKNGYFYFEAMVADQKTVSSFTVDKLLKCTWVRNRNIDLVDFVVRPDGHLIARAFHPAQSINFEEFVFTAYVLAVEADRMEYLISENDDY